MAVGSSVKAKTGQWSEAAKKVLAERYLWKKHGRIVEDEDGMCRRVARAVAAAEDKYGPDGEREAVEEAFHELMIERKFMPNSPTLMNAGKDNGQQLSACFVLPVPDSIDGIFDSVKHAAIIHKSGGGTGFAFSRLRPEGSVVSATSGVASGPVSFMRIFNEATEQIKQGGTRRGANMGILRVDHPDILKFINCKRDGTITNFNISVAATDKFMQALESGTEYQLVDPSTGKVTGTLNAQDVFNQIVDAAWATGDPGMVFLDRINAGPANPTPELGQVEATNPCGEQPLLPYEACNLGSLNVAAFVRRQEATGKGQGRFPLLPGEDQGDGFGAPALGTLDSGLIDWSEMEKAIRASVRFLDDVIEINPYPLPEIVRMVEANRRIGLGVMGWADLLFELGIPYNSEQALALAAEVMEFINHVGHDECEKLAQERSPFPNWAQSIYRDGRPLRNATVTTIAPTGTISIIADCSSGIEPIFALAFVHKARGADGKPRNLRFINPVFERVAKEQGFWSEELMEKVLEHGSVDGLSEVPEDVRRVFVTAHEIAPEWHVRMQAAFQKHTDNAVSKTINLPNHATVEDVANAYKLAYASGCNGITVFRDGCKGEQVLVTGAGLGARDSGPGVGALQTEFSVAPDGSVQQGMAAQIKPRPAVVQGYTRAIKAPEGTVNITINSDDAGPLEVFINVGRAGNDVAAMAEAIGRLISLNLRLPSPMTPNARLKEIASQLRNIGGSRTVGFGAAQVRSLPDAVAQAIEKHLGIANGNAASLGSGTISSEPASSTSAWTGNICSSCGCNTLVYEEGCKKCHACGYSEC